ncbi:MAG: hypothetical protein NC911_04755 [Candidatus Omnitrophica bacterium]|nr:hypothetical protein [Candidatus Omnitrophota bacterium]
MRRKGRLFLAIFAGVISVATAEISREGVIKKLIEKYQGKEFRGKLEITARQGENYITIPCQFWVKGSKVRLDLTLKQPGLDEPMEHLILMDDKGVTIFQKKLGLVMKLDLTRLPEDMKKQMKNVKDYTSPEQVMRQIMTLGEKLKITEKTKDGRHYYLFEVENIQELMRELPMLDQQNIRLGKLTLWILSSDLTFERLEVFGKENQAEVVVDFKELLAEKIADSSFDLKIPSDAQVLDLTDMLLRMREATREKKLTQPQ